MAAETKRILIVEDEPSLLELLSLYFTTKLGWEVVTAGSGAAAFEAFQSGPFHMLLADVDLGRAPDGIEVARQLREQEPPLKVVIMSGEPKNEARARAAGLETFLAKPFDLPDLGTVFCCAP
ncbi:MAG: response regulator [Elusimicrobia bacterium]|nr:response regulator [Elusimicrobiota bacterium]